MSFSLRFTHADFIYSTTWISGAKDNMNVNVYLII